MRGIYIHIPFCLRKCPYCDFYSVTLDRSLSEQYIDALIRNFRADKYRGVSADTVYIGGGTPSVLTSEQISRLMQGVHECFEIDKNAEITIEANPCTVSDDKLAAYRASGINRISFGVQSADDRELKALGRLHDFDTAARAIEGAQRAGFDNISADMMIGLSGQSERDVLNSAERLTALPIRHISAYMLKIEPNTPFDNDKLKASLPGDDKVSDMYLSLCKFLEGKGFYQYEISNFAQTGFESRHNTKYWRLEEYIGFGPAAHSLFDKRRLRVPRDLRGFISAPLQTETPEEEPFDERVEYIMLSLRLREGLDMQRLSALVGSSSAQKLKERAAAFEKHGLCRLSDGRVSLTPEGFLVSNSVILEFLCTVGLA